MAETINIAKMAEKLSKGIFLEFLWGRMERTNLNWPCEDEAKHGVKTISLYTSPLSLKLT